MKHLRPTLTALLLALACLLAVACENPFDSGNDNGGGQGDDTFAAAFECIEGPTGTLRCTATVSGGRAPIVYRWQPDFLDVRVITGVNTVSFNYGQICEGREDPITVSVKLTVKDADNKERGPIDKPFQICG